MNDIIKMGNAYKTFLIKASRWWIDIDKKWSSLFITSEVKIKISMCQEIDAHGK